MVLLYVIAIILAGAAGIALNSAIYMVSVITDAVCQFVQWVFTGMLIWHIVKHGRRK